MQGPRQPQHRTHTSNAPTHRGAPLPDPNAQPQVEGAIREIYAEMLQLQQREQEMRDINGARPEGGQGRRGAHAPAGADQG